MSFFFNKSEAKDNLQYDDTAFLHFAISTCAVTSLIFVSLIFKDIRSKQRSPYKALNKIQYFKDRVIKKEKQEKSYFATSSFLFKFGIVLVALAFGLLAFGNINHDSKMIGFDPYEILGVEMDAPINTIKKAYRKLALSVHPDRNVNNPQAAAKFIQISKAYQCLTDQQAKEKCKKYGNPDGEQSYKVGIGLPRFMIDVQNQYFFLFPIFIVLLIVVPRAFIKWSNRIKPKDDNGILLANYPILYQFITPAMNPVTFSVLFGMMKQLDPLFSNSKKNQALDPEIENGYKSLLINTNTLKPEQLQNIPPSILYRCCAVYSYIANKSKKEGLDELIPEVCRKIILYTLFYTQKGSHGKFLLNDPKMPINYYGIPPTKVAIYFTRLMYNPSVREVRSIQFLDLTPEEELMAKNIPIGNLQQNLLWNDEAIKTLVGNFSENRQRYVREQIEALPALRIETKLLLGDDEATEMTIDDFGMIQIKVIRKKETPGFVITKDYKALAKEQFYLMASYNQNLMFFTELKFEQGSNEAVYKFQHRQNVIQPMKFDIELISACYPNMDIHAEFHFNVTGRVQNRGVEIHKEDQNIDKLPKNFFESMASMETLNQSDRQLSEGSDDEERENFEGQKRKGFVEEEHHEYRGHHCSDC